MNKKLLASAGALVAVGLAAGGAFTASVNTDVQKSAGYANVTVDGAATVNDIVFNYASATDRSTVSTVDITFAAAPTGDVQAQFDAGAFVDCTDTVADTTYTYRCDFVSQNVSTPAINDFNISIIDVDGTV